jgi:general secretion pathway protein B
LIRENGLSYILDALKKADAERERSAVPGLHAHPQDESAGRDRREGGLPWPALAIAAIVLLAAALLWTLWSDRGVRTPPLMAEAPPLPPAAAAPAPEAVPAPPAAPGPAPAPPAQTAPAPTPTPAPIPAAAVTAAAPTAPPAPAPAPAPVPVARATLPAPKPATPAEPRVPSLNELPADVRASLPALAISAAVFSPTPSARMLFINGQVLREGQAVADGVVIERIGASASVLSVRGQRFEVKH